MLTVILHSLRRRTAQLLVAAGLLVAPAVLAQSGLGDIVYTVATTTIDATNRPWAYILWQATTPSLLSGRTFAVYSKPGDATNPAPYVRLSVVQLQTDARSIEPLLRRAVNVGEDSARLQQDMMQLFASLLPASSISRADQLSAVIRGSLVDPEHYNNLTLLARNHPGVALCLGFAEAQPIAPGQTTFEIRNFDLAKDQDISVVGRVTVDTTQPDVLPAPGPPVLVPDTTARGDINLKFRWGTPDALRRLGLLHFGYNLWRVRKDYFTSNSWPNPPSTALLVGAGLANSNAVRRVNRLPIVPGKLFGLSDAANVTLPGGDTNTMFISDDDGRYKPGYVNNGFTNGAQFYYFATARDILARDGLVSTGTLATVCDRMPPPVPMKIRVANDYSYNTNSGVSLQALRVDWNQVTNFTLLYFTNKSTGKVLTNYSDTVTNYWIYRWTSVTQMNARSGDISNNLIGVVRHVKGERLNRFLDVGPGAPDTNNYGQTFWYSVRAGDAGACGQNLSGNSGPAYGVLRKRYGPPAPTASIDFNCPRPVVDYVAAYAKPLRTGDATNYDFMVTCLRSNAQIAWAQFMVVQLVYLPGAGLFLQTNDLGTVYYAPGAPWVSVPFSYSRQDYVSYTVFYCRAGTGDGKVTAYAASPQIPTTGIALPDSKSVLEVDFSARMVGARAPLYPERQGNTPCRFHDPVDPGTGLISPVNICLFPSVGSKEWRLYQRVDEGPLTLFAQGAVTNPAVSICIPDDTIPASPGTVCYYGQLFDENGNASPLVRFACLDIGTQDSIPTPLLSPITATGNTNGPGVSLIWFCPPAGVERFLVWVGVPSGSAPPSQTLSPLLGFTNGFGIVKYVTNNATVALYEFYPYNTPKVGSGFGAGGPQFQIPAAIEIGKNYAVFVEAMGKHGQPGLPSNVETFLWSPTNAPGPRVPWPARALPDTNGTFLGLAFFLAPTNAYVGVRAPDTGVGVLIGAGPVSADQKVGQRPIQVIGMLDPNAYVATNKGGASLFPLALYRYQVPNANFPTVSGDVVQVSPLMESIAYTPGSNSVLIQDPFISFTRVVSVGYLWVLDTQPQISGATYKYLMVRFGASREIEEIIPTNEVTVP